MYSALFEVNSWIGVEQYIFTAESPNEILAEFQRVQDLSCLINMGMQRENKAGKESLKKLEALLSKYYSDELTMDDLKSLHVKISLGTFRCVDTAEGENAESTLREKYPGAK